MTDTKMNPEFKSHVFKLLYGQVTEEERGAIEKQLQTDKKAVAWYAEQVMICMALRNNQAVKNEHYDDVPSFDSIEMKALANYEKLAPVVHIPQPKSQQPFITKRDPVEKIPRKINKFSLYTTIISTAAFLAVIAYLHFAPKPVAQPVATLTDATQAVWSADGKLAKGQEIGADDWHELLQGFAEITFDNGAVATLEAPVSFMCQSAGSIYVESGKVYTKVTPRAVGFTVDTPHSKVIDLGTEFGVNVNKEACDVQVHKGLVRLYAQPRYDDTSVENRQIKAGQACRVESNSRNITRIQYDAAEFQTTLPSPYEAAIRAKKPLYYWNFEGTSQQPIKNLMNAEYGTAFYPPTAQFTEGPTLQADRVNQALMLSETPIEINDTLFKQIGSQQNFTYVFWTRPDVVSLENGCDIITTTVEKNGKIKASRHIRLNSNGVFQDSFAYANGVTAAFVVGKTVARPGQWYMVAVVANGQKKKLFVNGVNEKTIVHSHGISSEDRLASVHKFYIGYVGDKSGSVLVGKNRTPFNGAIDEVAIFDRALTDKEIRKLYDAASTKP